MKLNEYQEMSKRTLPSCYHSKTKRILNLSNYAMGLAGESGEVVDLLKKHLHHDHQLDRQELKNELGDTLHYLAGIASMVGLSLEDVATANIEKLRKRYPTGFNSQDSINREI